MTCIVASDLELSDLDRRGEGPSDEENELVGRGQESLFNLVCKYEVKGINVN